MVVVNSSIRLTVNAREATKALNAIKAQLAEIQRSSVIQFGGGRVPQTGSRGPRPLRPPRPPRGPRSPGGSSEGAISSESNNRVTRAFFDIFIGRAIFSATSNLITFFGTIDDTRRAIESLNTTRIDGITEGARDVDFLLNTARRLGLGFDSLLGNFRLYSAGVRDVFSDTAEGNAVLRETFANLQGFLRVTGATTQEQFNSVRAIIDIVSKEGASAGQELRRQLTNSVTDFRNILGDAFNNTLSFDQIVEGLNTGAISVFDFLTKLSEQFAERTEDVIGGIQESLGTAINRVRTSFTEIGVIFSRSGALSGITSLVNQFDALVMSVGRFVATNPELASTALQVIAIGAALTGLGFIFRGIIGLVRGILSPVAALAAAFTFLTKRANLVAVGIFALGAVILKFTGQLDRLVNFVKSAITPAFDTLTESARRFSQEFLDAATNSEFGNRINQQTKEAAAATSSLLNQVADEFSNFLFHSQTSFSDFLRNIAEDIARSQIRNLFQNLFSSDPIDPDEPISESVGRLRQRQIERSSAPAPQSALSQALSVLDESNLSEDERNRRRLAERNQGASSTAGQIPIPLGIGPDEQFTGSDNFRLNIPTLSPALRQGLLGPLGILASTPINPLGMNADIYLQSINRTLSRPIHITLNDGGQLRSGTMQFGADGGTGVSSALLSSLVGNPALPSIDEVIL